MEWNRYVCGCNRVWRYEIKRAQQRCPDSSPTVKQLRNLRACVAKLKAVADAAREQNTIALYALQDALGDAPERAFPSPTQ